MLPGWTRGEIAGKPADLFHPPRDVLPKSAVLFLHDLDERTLADFGSTSRGGWKRSAGLPAISPRVQPGSMVAP